MIAEDRKAAEQLWVELLECLGQRCSKEGLAFRRINSNGGQIERGGTPLLKILFDSASRRPLSYELENCPPRELGVLVTSAGRADFRMDGVSYSAEHLANLMIGEIL